MKSPLSWLLTTAGKCLPEQIWLHRPHRSSYGKHGGKLTAVRHGKCCWVPDTNTLTHNSQVEIKERRTSLSLLHKLLNLQTAISWNSCSWNISTSKRRETKQTNRNLIVLKGRYNRESNTYQILPRTHKALYKSLYVFPWLLMSGSCPTLVGKIMALLGHYHYYYYYISPTAIVTPGTMNRLGYMEKTNEGCRRN